MRKPEPKKSWNPKSPHATTKEKPPATVWKFKPISEKLVSYLDIKKSKEAVTELAKCIVWSFFTTPEPQRDTDKADLNHAAEWIIDRRLGEGRLLRD
jgi:hypothetical protein